jgi:hypothetical protein
VPTARLALPAEHLVLRLVPKKKKKEKSKVDGTLASQCMASGAGWCVAPAAAWASRQS